MKVHIFTEGGKDIGFGHISRCSALYEEISTRGIQVDFIVTGDVNGVSFLEGIKIINDNWVDNDYLVNRISKEDYVIIDSYKTEKEIYNLISSLSKKALYIDDTGRLQYPKGIIVNPSLDASSIQYPENYESSYHSGADYVILRSPFIDIHRNNVNTVVKTVLITIGGSDLRNLTPTIIEEICYKYPKIRFEIVKGVALYNSDEMEKQITDNIFLHYNVDSNKMKDLMISSDFAITAAGQTIYELLATKTPFIPIKIADNQTNNIDSLINMDLIYDSVDFSTSINIRELKNIFIKMLDFSVRQNMIDKFQKVLDSKGRTRIINKLLNSMDDAIMFRKISMNDCDIMYTWANDELVRKNSFNSQKINYESHKKWFQHKLNDCNSLIYIVLKNDLPVGQIRIEVEGEIGIIDYSIDTKYRGKGLGSNLLKLIGSKVKYDCTEIRELVGKVKYDNMPSQKAFENANYHKLLINDYFEYHMKI